MTNWAQAERHALCDLFTEVGPDAPTLSGEWSTRDLAAHLIVREHRLDAAAGILIKPLAAHGNKVRLAVAARPWPELIETVRSGPPKWSPTRLEFVDKAANTTEFFVHHEDVRRAAAGWEPRHLDDAFAEDLDGQLRRSARMFMRKAPCGVVLEPLHGDPITAKKGEPVATVRGDIGELVLFCFGRQAHSRVDISPDDDAANSLRAAAFGI